MNAIAPGPFPSRRASLEPPLMLAEFSLQSRAAGSEIAATLPASPASSPRRFPATSPAPSSRSTAARGFRLPSVSGSPRRLRRFGPGPLDRAGVREKRGAGAGWITPSRSTKVPRAACADAPAPRQRQHRREAGVGALEERAPLVARLRRGRSRRAAPHRRPGGAVHAGREAVVAEARALEQLGVELRLDRADRDVLAVGASRRARRSARRRRAGCRRARRCTAPPARMP